MINKQVDRDATEVVIEPGDFLYHPAGIWHSVKCDQDSCTINFSMQNINIAEIVTHSLKHLMNSDDFWRQNITFNDHNDFQNLLNKGLENAQSLLTSLSPSMIGPSNLFIPRYLKYDLTDSQQIQIILSKIENIKISKNTKLWFNPLSMMLRVSEIPQDEIQQQDSNDVEFIIHHNYGGTKDYESDMRVEIHAGPDYYKLFKKLAKDRILKRDSVFAISQYQDKCDYSINNIIKILIFQGFLMIK